MGYIKSLYNRNRKKIWSVITIISIVLGIIYFMNYLAAREQEELLNSYIPQIEEDDDIISNDENFILGEEESVTTGNSLSQKDKDNITYIEMFYNYLISGDISNAYNMLSEYSKEEVYQTQEEFEKYYVDEYNINKNTITSIKNWSNDIFICTTKINPLLTGEKNEDSKDDYITVVEENDEYKLNLKGLVSVNENITRSENSEYFTANIVKEVQYMNYTEYTYSITNNTNKTIALTDTATVDNIYIVDKNGIEHEVYSHELIQSELIIDGNETKTITLKYYSAYLSDKKIEYNVFEEVILDYNVYSNLQKKSLYNDYYELRI